MFEPEERIRRGYLDTPAGQVFTLDNGAGEPLILLHQTPRSSSMFVPLMRLLAPRYRTIALDMLGYGDSPAPPAASDGSVDARELGRNVIHALDALGIDRAHVFGFHTGAFAAAVAAAEAPGRIGALVLGGYPYIADAADFERFFEGQETLLTLNRPATDSLDGSHAVSMWMKAYSEVQKWWLHSVGTPTDPNASSLLRHPSPHRPAHSFLTGEELAFIRRWTADFYRIRSTAEIYKSMLGGDARSVLSGISAPTLHLEADSPYESPFCRRGEEVATLVPDCRAVVVPQSDDNMMEFNPQAVASIVEEFLASHAFSAEG